MTDVKIENSNKLKSTTGSTETLDGLNDFEESNTTSDKQPRRRPNNLTIILISVFLAWLLLFMSVTIYQIRSYKKQRDQRNFRRAVNEEVKWIKKTEVVNPKGPEPNTKIEEGLKQNLDLEKTPKREKVTSHVEGVPTESVSGEATLPTDEETLPEETVKTEDSDTKLGESKVVGGVDSPKDGQDVIVRLPGDEAKSKPVDKVETVDENVVPGSRRDSISPEGVRTVRVQLKHNPFPEVKRRPRRVFTDIETFMTPKELQTARKFEDLTFKKQSENCYRKDFFRTNISGTGTNMRLVVKRSNIGKTASLNSGQCVTIYHWIYNNPLTKETHTFYLGPYYGHYSINIYDYLHGRSDPTGTFKIFGCAETEDGYTKSPVTKHKEKIIRGNVFIDKELFMYDDFRKFQKHLEKKSKEEMYDNKRLFTVFENGPKAIDDFQHLNEVANCIYDL